MADIDHSPLTQADLDQINNALKQIAIARAQINLATRAGFDMSANAKSLDAAENQLRQIKQVYFPGKA